MFVNVTKTRLSKFLDRNPFEQIKENSLKLRTAPNRGYLTVGLQRLFDTGGRVSSCLAPRNPRSRWRTSATIFPRGKTETSSRVFRHFAFLEISNPQAESARVFTEAGASQRITYSL
jgi:hypothetical protein